MSCDGWIDWAGVENGTMYFPSLFYKKLCFWSFTIPNIMLRYSIIVEKWWIQMIEIDISFVYLREDMLKFMLIIDYKINLKASLYEKLILWRLQIMRSFNMRFFKKFSSLFEALKSWGLSIWSPPILNAPYSRALRIGSTHYMKGSNCEKIIN